MQLSFFITMLGGYGREAIFREVVSKKKTKLCYVREKLLIITFTNTSKLSLNVRY